MIRFFRDSYERNSGQSVIEVIVAVSIFLIIAGSSVISVVGSLSASRLGEEESTATILAEEGLQAAVSIRDQDWDLLSDGAHGVSNSSGTWSFSDSSDQNDKYTRMVQVDPVMRGGNPDPDSKQVTASVTWNFTSVRPETVSISTELTNWQESTFYSLTPTPSLTNTPPVATDTPAASSCNQFCIQQGYSTGACRKNANQCNQNGETNETGGDQYCTQPPNTSCCCAP